VCVQLKTVGMPCLNKSGQLVHCIECVAPRSEFGLSLKYAEVVVQNKRISRGINTIYSVRVRLHQLIFTT
jgi:hypothetical protein